MFSVVEFISEHTSAVVPDCWIDGNFSFWPTNSGPGKITQAAKNKILPDSTWEKYPVRILASAETYDAANQKLSRSSETSDLNSDKDGSKKQRKRKKPVRYVLSSSSEEDVSQIKSSKTSGTSNVAQVLIPPVPPKRITCYEIGSNANFVAEACAPVGKENMVQENLTEDSSSQCSVLKDISPNNFSPLEKRMSVTEEQQKDASFSLSKVMCVGRPQITTSKSIVGTLTDLNTRELLEKSIAFQLRILKAIEEVRQQGELNRKDIQNLLFQTGVSNTCETLDEISFLPTASEEDMSFLEKFLENSENKIKLTSYLSSTGGQGYDDITRRVLLRVMSNSFATKYSFTGRKGKKSFSSLKLKNVVFAAVRNHSGCSSATEKDLGVTVGNWLRFAPERCKAKRNSSTTSKDKENETASHPL